jgi:hypothetical protein
MASDPAQVAKVAKLWLDGLKLSFIEEVESSRRNNSEQEYFENLRPWLQPNDAPRNPRDAYPLLEFVDDYPAAPTFLDPAAPIGSAEPNSGVWGSLRLSLEAAAFFRSWLRAHDLDPYTGAPITDRAHDYWRAWIHDLCLPWCAKHPDAASPTDAFPRPIPPVADHPPLRTRHPVRDLFGFLSTMRRFRKR